MFTAKFYRPDETTIIECEDLRVLRDLADGSAQIMAFTKGIQQTFYVGPSRVAGDLGEIIYDKAIVENAAGKTTEIIVPRMKGPEPGTITYPDRERVAKPPTDTGKTLQEWRDLLKETEGHGGAAAGRTS
jgi:hypothetical protein